MTILWTVDAEEVITALQSQRMHQRSRFPGGGTAVWCLSVRQCGPTDTFHKNRFLYFTVNHLKYG